MVRATADVQSTFDYDLKSVEGGVVTIRRMTYGQLLERRDMAMRMEMEQVTGTKEAKGELKITQAEVALYDFAHCIVDHNLEDENGNKLNFSKREDIVRLDPRVGDEVGMLIDKLNQFEDQLGN
jgi:hypothetical protein